MLLLGAVIVYTPTMMRNIVGTRAEAPVAEQNHNCSPILSAGCCALVYREDDITLCRTTSWLQIQKLDLSGYVHVCMCVCVCVCVCVEYLDTTNGTQLFAFTM